MHGIAPTAARKSGAKLKAYPRMSFHISIVGGAEMNYRIERIGAFTAVGVKYQVNTDKSPGLIPLIWNEIRQNGIANKLCELASKSSTKEPGGVLGICSDGDFGRNEEFNYYIAVPCDKEPPEGMEKVSFPESQWVVFEAPTLVDIIKSWRRLYTDWVPTSGYSLAALPGVECYYRPGHNPQNELWIPIEKLM